MRTRSTITTKHGITWYYEQEGTGPHVVLIPDGLGESQMFDKPMSLIANGGFTVTTFDTPGFSRSSSAPPETYEDITAQKLASYIIELLDELRIDVAAFWGSSSGGSAVLALASEYPERVRNGMPHEVPTSTAKEFTDLAKLDDEAISKTLSRQVREALVGNVVAWDALGEEVHSRLWTNYPRWARGYPRTLPQTSSMAIEDLTKRPLDWTVGASTPVAPFLSNIVTATKAGVNFSVISGMHFPYVSDPEAFAEHVVTTARKYL